MRILFVHQYFPGQFAPLARWLVDEGHEVTALHRGLADGRSSKPVDGVRLMTYGTEIGPERAANPVLARNEQFVREAASAAFAAMSLRSAGWLPDLVYSHSGWGTGAFMAEIFPEARHVSYCEWYYGVPDDGDGIESRVMTGLSNIPISADLMRADLLIAPTEWQRSQFPAGIRRLIEVVPDGVDMDFFSPDASASFMLADGRRLTSQDRVVTYVARGADPFRGFEPFLKAVALLQAEDPAIEAVILGDRLTYYGRGNGTYEHFNAVTSSVAYDPSRTHFMGTVDKEAYRDLLRISAAHVYMTMPFVLSWSALEAMATGCAMVASSTAPVLEFMQHRENSLLCNIDRPEHIAERIREARSAGATVETMRKAARRTIAGRWTSDIARERHRVLISRLLAEDRPASG